jgi:ribose/xylose/arabinose/galactoside ABC-type transport system permease subunit
MASTLSTRVSVAGTAMGVLILGLIQTLINFQGNLSSWWTRIVVGILVLVFILLQNVITPASRRLGETRQRSPGTGGVRT